MNQISDWADMLRNADSEHWKLSVFYYNPGDPRVFVLKRSRTGITLNFARPIIWATGFRRLRFSFAHGLAIVVVAAVLCLPFLLVGIPSGYDTTIHEMYQYYFSRQFWGGDLYPRWLAEANKGFGSPIFLVQYPLPYFVTALLRPILPIAATSTRESRELGVYCFLVLAAAGLSARTWFRSRCTALASTLAAVVYISLPDILGQALYARVAIGELTVFVFMPLMLAFCDRAQRMPFAMLNAVAFALLVLSNTLYAALFVPVIFLYAIASGKRALLTVLPGLGLGICIAAAYVFPLVDYQSIFHPHALIALHPGLELGRNLLYISLDQVRNHRFAIPGIIAATCLALFTAHRIWYHGGHLVARVGMLVTLGLGTLLLVPGVGPAVIDVSHLKLSRFPGPWDNPFTMLFTALATLCLALLSYCRVSASGNDRRRDRLLLVLACTAFFFMLPWSAVIWRAVPRTEIIQFPWRLCAVLTVAAAGLFSSAVDDCLRHGVPGEKSPSLAVMTLVALSVIGAGAIIWRVDLKLRPPSTPRVEVARWVDPMYSTYISSSALSAFARIVGTSPDTFNVNSTPVEEGVRAEFVAGKGDVSVMRVGPRKLLVSARCQGDGRVRIGQLYFPLWTIVPTTPYPREEVLGSSAEGLIEVSLSSGRHDFELMFDGGLPERAGDIVTMASITVVAGWFAFVGLRTLLRSVSTKA